ncbi:MAG: putative zinc-binding metallopeptidase [Bacteroides sp.]
MGRYLHGEVGQQTLRSYIPSNFCGECHYRCGSTTEGTAEGGRQIVLYSVNDFNFTLEQIQSYAHDAHSLLFLRM